ncbi:MAG: hypothetical protein QG585_58 [Patescibacteria group bacterium]|jgi:hypothetical protein|nr:hypothetical protein [Patescibacteria group bacterium]
MKPKAQRQYRWFVSVDDKTNGFIYTNLGHGWYTATYEDQRCSDGEVRNLWELSKERLEQLRELSKRVTISFLVFRQFDGGAYVLVREKSVKVEKPVFPLTQPKQEWPDTDNGEPPPF